MVPITIITTILCQPHGGIYQWSSGKTWVSLVRGLLFTSERKQNTTEVGYGFFKVELHVAIYAIFGINLCVRVREVYVLCFAES